MLSNLINVDPVILALIATTFTWLMTLLGASIVFFFKKVNKNVMDAMLGIAAGVMIAASFWSLLDPGIELANELNKNSVLIAIVGFMSGGVILFLGDKVCDKILKKSKRADTGSFKRSLLLIVSITLHNIPEDCSCYVSRKKYNIGLKLKTTNHNLYYCFGSFSINYYFLIVIFSIVSSS